MLLSTITTHEDVKAHFLTDDARRDSARWHRRHGFGRVYLSTYRGGYTTPDDVIEGTKAAFASEGAEVCGCVCPTDLGTASNGWKDTSCFSDPVARTELQRVFTHAASHFDEVIIDNRLFYDCTCEKCRANKGDRTWSGFHREVLTDVFEQNVIGAAKEANADARLILKYPSWYESVASRGYDVVEHSSLFPRVCAGAETRDPLSDKWGRRQPIGAYVGAAWFADAADGKCDAAWFDYISCPESVFVAQVCGSALAGCDELIFFNFGAYLKEEGEGDYPAPSRLLDAALSDLRDLDQLMSRIESGNPIGVAAYRAPHADARDEPYVFDFMAGLGLPITPVASFPMDAPCAAFAQSSFDDSDFIPQLKVYIETGRPTLLTSRLAMETPRQLRTAPNVSMLDTHGLHFPDRLHRLDVAGDESSDLEPAERLLEMGDLQREALLRPFYSALGLAIDAHRGCTPILLAEGAVAMFDPSDGTATVIDNARTKA